MFVGCREVVAGFKQRELNTRGRKMFDKISGNEQVIIENVNCWVKKAGPCLLCERNKIQASP